MADSLYALVGETIRRRRDVLGMTQSVLGARIGLSRASVANIEQGRQSLALHQAYLAADALGMSLSEMLPDRIPDETRRPQGRSVDLGDLLGRLRPALEAPGR